MSLFFYEVGMVSVFRTTLMALCQLTQRRKNLTILLSRQLYDVDTTALRCRYDSSTMLIRQLYDADAVGGRFIKVFLDT